jgi:hypothetical protein
MGPEKNIHYMWDFTLNLDGTVMTSEENYIKKYQSSSVVSECTLFNKMKC